MIFERKGELFFLVSKLRKLMLYISKNKFSANEMLYDHL
jgi:ribosomal protein S15P/S13E